MQTRLNVVCLGFLGFICKCWLFISSFYVNICVYALRTYMHVCVCHIRDHRCRGGRAVSEGGHPDEGVPSHQRSLSAGHPVASGRATPGGTTLYETRGPPPLHTL